MNTVSENPNRITNDFLDDFRLATETRWHSEDINPALYGFQFQPGTRWNPGLQESAIIEYQKLLGLRFPYDFQSFIGKMNGTDLPTVNVYSSAGHPTAYSVGVFSHPRDIDIVRQRIQVIHRNRPEIAMDLADQGFDLAPEAGLMPIFSHRYIVCSSDHESSAVLSIVTDDVDAIVYANSLREYLEKEFLQ